MQNASSFSSRIGSWRKGLKSRCEFVFLDAPFEATGLPGGSVSDAQGEDVGGRSWWQWKDTGLDARPSRAAQYTGWETTQQLLVDAIKQHQPHGILGFSQGATAGAILMATLQKDDVKGHLDGTPLPKFGILVAGFVPRDPSYASIVQGAPVETPALMIHGLGDTLVDTDRNKGLRECFHDDALHVYEHEGGHVVPTCSGNFKQELVAFLEKVTRA